MKVNWCATIDQFDFFFDITCTSGIAEVTPLNVARPFIVGGVCAVVVLAGLCLPQGSCLNPRLQEERMVWILVPEFRGSLAWP
jgi:hypothetical protein